MDFDDAIEPMREVELGALVQRRWFSDLTLNGRVGGQAQAFFPGGSACVDF